MAASHVVGGSTNITLPIPLYSTGHTIVGGWYRMDAGSAAGTGLYLSNGALIVRNFLAWVSGRITEDVWAPADFQLASLQLQTTTVSLDPDCLGVWYYIVVDRSTAGITIWFAREGAKQLSRKLETTAQTDNGTSLVIGAAGAGVNSSAQYWWCYQGSTPPTSDQLYAMMQTSTPNSVFTVSRFWPLADGSLVATIGGVNATGSPTASSFSAPAAAIAAPNELYSTLVSPYQYNTSRGDSQCATSPLTIGSVGTPSVNTLTSWIRVPPTSDTNSYFFSFLAPTGRVLLFVVQHNVGQTWIQINVMASDQPGDVCVYVPIDCTTEARAVGWLFVAWIISQNGTNTTISTYLGIGEGSTLALLGTESLPVASTFDSTCVPTIGTGANGYNLRHLRLYSGTTAPTLSALQTIMGRSSADPSAWADWGFADGSTADRSGNARHLIPNVSEFRGLSSPNLTRAVDGVGAVDGVASVSGAGRALYSSVGAADGVASVSAVGRPLNSSVGAADGVTSVSGVGRSLNSSVGAADGICSVAGNGQSLAQSAGLSNGVASVFSQGGALKLAVGAANGKVTVSGEGRIVVEGAGAVTGTSNITGVGRSIARGTGIVSGTSNNVGVGSSIAQSSGASNGTCSVRGVLVSISEGSLSPGVFSTLYPPQSGTFVSLKATGPGSDLWYSETLGWVTEPALRTVLPRVITNILISGLPAGYHTRIVFG